MSFSQEATLPVARRRRHKRTRPAARGKKVRYRIHWIYPTILVAMVVLFVSMYLCQCANQIRVQYDIGQMKNQKEKLMVEQREILLAIENLESLERIEKIAKEDMNMVHPSRRLILNLNQPTSTAYSEDVSMASFTR